MPESPPSSPRPRVAEALRRHLQAARLDELPSERDPERAASLEAWLAGQVELGDSATPRAAAIYPAGEHEVRRVLGLAVRCRHGELGSHLWS
jgi:predicted NAD/FAD-binding protein